MSVGSVQTMMGVLGGEIGMLFNVKTTRQQPQRWCTVAAPHAIQPTRQESRWGMLAASSCFQRANRALNCELGYESYRELFLALSACRGDL